MAKTVQCGLRERLNFGKEQEALGVPNLIRVQAVSFSDFLQKDAAPDARTEMGLQAAFQSVFPIEGYNGTAQLEFIDYALGKPKFDVRECLERGMTFAASLRIRACARPSPGIRIRSPSPRCTNSIPNSGSPRRRKK